MNKKKELVQAKQNHTLLDLAYLIINYAKDINDIELIKESYILIKESTITHLLPILEFILTHYNGNNEIPDINYINANYNGIVPNMRHIPYHSTFISEFKRLLREDNILFRVINVANSGKLDEVKLLINSNNASKIEDEFTLRDIKPAYNRFKELTSSDSGGFIKTCVPALDELLIGLLPQTLNVLAGGPGSCKTTFAVSMTYNSVFNKGFNIIYISLEVASKLIYFDLMSRHSLEMGIPVDCQKIKYATLTEQDEVNLDKAIDDWESNAKGKFSVLGVSNFNKFCPSDITAAVQEKIDEWGHVDMVVLDHLNLTKYHKLPGINDEKEIQNFYVNYFTDLSISSNNGKGFVMLMLAQVNRSGQDRIAAGKAPTLTSLAEAHELERRASTAMILSANVMANSLSVYLCKNRDGSPRDEAISTYVNPAQFIVGHREFKELFKASDMSITGSTNNDQPITTELSQFQ